MSKTSLQRAIVVSVLTLGACGAEPETPARTAGSTSGPSLAGRMATPNVGAAGGSSAAPPFSVGNGSTPPSVTPIPSAGAQPPSAPAASAMPSAGSTGAALPPSAAGMNAQRAPKEDLDPNLQFDWQETTPGTGAAKACRAGAYSGTSLYLCMPVDAGFIDPGAGFGAELMATITLELVESADGEFLQIKDGKFSSLSADVFGLVADLRGKLDCSTLKFTATTENGGWGIGDPNTGVLPLGTFEAELTGMLDPATGTLSGDWTITGSVPFICKGPWSAMLK